MKRAAVIDSNTGEVLNFIVADAAVDVSPEPNSFLVDAGEVPLTFDFVWTQDAGLVAPALPSVDIPPNAAPLQQPADQGPPNVD